MDLDVRKVAGVSSLPNLQVRPVVFTKFEPVMNTGLLPPLKPTLGTIPEIRGGN
jgi:hypothetical protein